MLGWLDDKARSLLCMDTEGLIQRLLAYIEKVTVRAQLSEQMFSHLHINAVALES